MEAYRIDRFGSVDGIVRRSSEDPRPGPKEVLMRVLSADLSTLPSRKRSSQRTQRWREMDSNFRFRAKGATDLSFRFCLCP